MDIKDILAAAIKAAAQKAIDSGALKPGTLPEVMLEVPPQKEFGDFATNLPAACTAHPVRLLKQL